jgi:HEAT repeat protein
MDPKIVEFVQQMPATDRDLEALKAQQAPPQPGPPDPTKKKAPPPVVGEASKFTGPDPQVADRICDQILAAGRAALLDLISLVRAAGDPDFKDYKAEYLLHCVVLAAGRPGRTAERKLVAETLASQLDNAQLSKPARALLVREVQWIGVAASGPELAGLLEDEELGLPAVAALVAIGGTGEWLRAALPKCKGRVRLALVQNLGVLRAGQAIEALRQAAGDEDRDVRLAAVWGLANLGEAGSIDLLLKAADTAAAYERIKATQACLVLAEKLAAAGRPGEARRIYTHLRDTRTDKPEAYLRELSEKALGKLG